MTYKKMLSVSADSKTVKGESLGFLTGILYLTPSDLSGYGELCPFAMLAGCKDGCLNSAGRGAFNSVQLARLNKTEMYFNNKNTFFYNLAKSINALITRAKRLGLKPLVRLNGTSDIQYERIPFYYNGIQYKNIFELFPTIQFYDYTKIPSRDNIPSNYDLTFSYSGVESFQPSILKALSNPAFNRIAVVFDKVENIPATFLDRKVLSGDDSDVRHLDAKNTIVALYAKGKAKKDFSGFVVRKIAGN